MAGIQQSGTYATPRMDLGQAMLEFMFEAKDFVGTKYYASLPVDKKKGTFPKITRESLLRPAARVKRAPKAAYERDGYEPEDFSYECQERGHEVPLDASDVEFYRDDFDAEMVASEVAMWRVLYDQEQDIANLVLDGTTTYTVANGRRTDVGTAWSDKAAPIVDDVQAAKEKIRTRTGVMGNTLLIGAGVVPFLLKNTDIKSALGDDKEKAIDAILARLKAILGLEKILIGNGVYNSAKKGATFSQADIWPSIWAVVGVTCDPGDPIVRPCVGRTFFWVEDTPTESVLIEEYLESQTRTKVIRGRSHADEIEMDPDFQQLLDIAA